MTTKASLSRSSLSYPSPNSMIRASRSEDESPNSLSSIKSAGGAGFHSSLLSVDEFKYLQTASSRVEYDEKGRCLISRGREGYEGVAYSKSYENWVNGTAGSERRSSTYPGCHGGRFVRGEIVNGVLSMLRARTLNACALCQVLPIVFTKG